MTSSADSPANLYRTGDNTRVDTPDRRVAVVFSNLADGVPMPVSVRCGGAKGILSIGGSTSRLTAQDEAALYNHVQAAFHNAPLRQTVLMSGGTRVIDTSETVTDDDARVVFTILELPWLIRKWHPSCRTLGHAPRTTETASLMGDHSTFIPSDQLDTKELVHPGLDVFWFVQATASQTTHDWGMDLTPVYDLLGTAREEGQATGLWVWGGGGVTGQEIAMATRDSHPCAVVAGSGRIADAVINWRRGLQDDIPPAETATLHKMLNEFGADLSQITVITTPGDTQRWLQRSGFTS